MRLLRCLKLPSYDRSLADQLQLIFENFALLKLFLMVERGRQGFLKEVALIGCVDLHRLCSKRPAADAVACYFCM